MQELLQHLPSDRRSPRLWFERLAIFDEPDEAHIFRTIPFRRGLNLVWAKEPTVGSARGTRAAGHGVGKTSLCLLLRFCLGETSKAVAELREELFDEFPQGGVGAVLHVDDQPFTLCRYFNSHKEGTARPGDDISRLWEVDSEYTDRDFMQKLADAMMKDVSPRCIPDTGQPIEWRHVVAWISRDQGSRFKSLFAWREGEGTGLQRSRQDPPIVMRAVLGLLQEAESTLMAQLSSLGQDLELAKRKTEELLQEPTLIRRRIESNLRAWGTLPDYLPLRSSDLFDDSIERRINAASEKATARLVEQDGQLEVIDQALAELRSEMKTLQSQQERANAEYELGDAARRRNEEDYRAAAGRLLTLTQLVGWCQHGNVEFQQCEHIRTEKVRLEGSTDMRDERDKKSLDRAMSESAANAAAALQRKQQIDQQIAALQKREASRLGERRKAWMARDTAAIEANQGKKLMEELERWERSAGSDQAQSAIETSRSNSARIEQEIGNVQTRLTILQQDRTTREKALAQIVDGLTRALLPDGAAGFFDPRDESRPFRLSLRGGEAYRVLEVLLGDIACMLDSARAETAFPGFLIHDCPREADMSMGLYENFLLLIDHLQREQYANQSPFQYIVTTTTPPPAELQGDGRICVTLDPSADDGLLFGRRFIGERQADITH